jgi:hypothetical protein
MTQNEYIPGVCNIGPDEIARRRNVGWVSLAISLVLFGVLKAADVDAWWRLLVFFPAALSASGFLQAYFHFCSGFGRLGLYNFMALGETYKVDDDLSKAKDKKKAYEIILYSVCIGGVAAIIAVALG